MDRPTRRLFLGQVAMAMAAAKCGVPGSEAATERVPREIAALAGASEWINSPRLTAADLAGKVVAVDFCTYTCINWLRTLPYLRAWTEKYGQSLVLIGVHTPEFPFEHDLDHVRRALRQLRVPYPIVVDNDYAIWRAFRNQYWPALYLLDAQGRIRDRYFGEGEYDRQERSIQQLLANAGAKAIDASVVSVEGAGVEAAADWANLKTPETYLGFERTQNYAPRTTRLQRNEWSRNADWSPGRHALSATAPGARITFRFHARDLHLVMGPSRAGNTVRFRVTIDGQPPAAARGLDVDESGQGTVIEPRMYQLIRQPRPIGDRTFAIEFLEAGVDAFSLTFG